MINKKVKNSNKTFRILFSLTMILLVSIATGSVGFAADATGTGTVEATVPVNGTINALTISVTHPTSVTYAIDPNLYGDSDVFVAPDISITNNTKVPITVTVKSLTATTGGTLQFTDVASDAYTWTELNAADSKTYIALGLKIEDATGWNDGYVTDTLYAVDISDSLFGSLNAGVTANMKMVANCGLAFDTYYTAAHNLVLMFELV